MKKIEIVSLLLTVMVMIATVTAPLQVQAAGFSGDFDVDDGEFVEQHIHEFATVTIAATCTMDGSITTSCVGCEESNAEVIPALGHDYVTETVPATCTEEGSVTTSCTRCEVAATEVIPALGHDYVTDVVEATVGMPGCITTACVRCKYSNVQVVPALQAETETETETEPAEPAASYSPRKKVLVSSAKELEDPREFQKTPIGREASSEEEAVAEARRTNFVLWWVLLLLTLILVCHQYHLVLVAKKEVGEDVTVLMYSWSIKAVMKKLAKLKGANPDAELKIFHFFRGKGKRIVYSWTADAEKSEYMSRHEAKVAESVLGFVYCADDEAEEDTSAEAETVA